MISTEPKTLTVTQLNRQIRSWLEVEVGEVAVTGELSNLAKPSSGHFYFTLKDSTAQLRCVYFRGHHSSASRQFKDGQQVIARGKLSIYEARGDYQLIVHTLEEAGLGELFRQFELLKIKLQALGLFDSSRKKSLPAMPMKIGIITSPSGAALRDILTTLQRRFPLAEVRLYGSEVQGKDAPQQLIKALNKANEEQFAEVLILARGGGSIEDLWAFNDEQLALAISRCTIPLVSGVGHETDFTIADFVADLRAATPTAAAEAVTPNQIELRSLLATYEERLFRSISRICQHKQLVLSHQLAKLSSPEQLIAKYWQTLDYKERQLYQTIKSLVAKKQQTLHQLIANLNLKNPQLLLHKSKLELQQLQQRLLAAMRTKETRLKQQLNMQMATLHAVSPLATLDRGYAIASYKENVLFDSKQVRQGDQIDLRLARGRLICEVVEIPAKEKDAIT